MKRWLYIPLGIAGALLCWAMIALPAKANDAAEAILKQLKADVALCINDYANSKCKEMEHEEPTD